METKIWILSELFYPEETSTSYILTEITKALAAHDHVHVICGPASYSNERLNSTEVLSENIIIERIVIGHWDKDKFFSRATRMFLLATKISWRVLRKVRQGDKVLVVTNPAPLLILISRICKWKKASLTIIVHDVFPENMVAAKLIKTKSIFYKSLLKLFNSAYRMADCLIVLGRDMRKILAEKSSLELEKIVIIPNWADTENIFPMRLQIKGPIVIQFAGNFGRVQGILPFLQSFYQADNQDVNVNLIGDGALRNEIGSYIYSNGQSNVKILPSFKRSQQKQILNECDIGLVTLAEGMMGLGVPSKSYNIMAAGKPILYIGDKDSEISLMIEEEGIGWTFQAFGSDLKRFLKELNQSHRPEINKMGDKAREVAIRRFSKKAILEEIIQTIDSI